MPNTLIPCFTLVPDTLLHTFGQNPAPNVCLIPFSTIVPNTLLYTCASYSAPHFYLIPCSTLVPDTLLYTCASYFVHTFLQNIARIAKRCPSKLPNSTSNQNQNQIKTKIWKGSIIAWFLVVVVVTLRTVLMLLWPLKMLTNN